MAANNIALIFELLKVAPSPLSGSFFLVLRNADFLPIQLTVLTTFKRSDYESVRRLGDEYRSRIPRSVLP